MKYLRKTTVKILVLVVIFTFVFPVSQVSAIPDDGNRGGSDSGGGSDRGYNENETIGDVEAQFDRELGKDAGVGGSGGRQGGRSESQKAQDAAKAAAKKAADDKSFFDKINEAIDEAKKEIKAARDDKINKAVEKANEAAKKAREQTNKSFADKAIDFITPSTGWGWARAAFGFVLGVGIVDQAISLGYTAINAVVTLVEKDIISTPDGIVAEEDDASGTTNVVSGTPGDDDSSVISGGDGNDALDGNVKDDTLAQDVSLSYEKLTEEEKERGAFYTLEEFLKLDLNKIFNVVAPPAVDQPAGPPPTLNFSTSGAVYGQTYTTLSWSSGNTTQCYGTNFDTFGRTSGSTNVSPNTTTTYSITCTGAGGSITKGILVEVVELPPPPTPPTLSFRASSTSVGDSSVLFWESVDTTTCVGVNFSTGGAVSGSVNVLQDTTTTYSITCTGEGGSVDEEVTVEVLAPKTSIDVILSNGDAVITWSTTDVENCIISGTDGFSYQISTESVTSGSVTNDSADQGTTYSIQCDIVGGN